MKMLTPGAYRLVVLDVKMPGIGGVELMVKMREIDRNLRFVFFTGHGEDVNRGVADGEDITVLAKPLRMSELIDAIRVTTGTAGEDGQ